MSRMNAIRNLAKSSLGAGALGAVAGGAGAYYSGGDMMAGAGYGAMGGAGLRAGAPLLAKAAGSMRIGIKGPISQAMRNLQKPGMKARAKVMARAHGALGSAYKGLSRMGAIKSGIAGGAVGLGYSTLNSNQGLNTTYRNATLNQRLKYDRAKGMQSSAIRINENRIKKSIWQPGAY
jgi:hypothetical protein